MALGGRATDPLRRLRGETAAHHAAPDDPDTRRRWEAAVRDAHRSRPTTGVSIADIATAAGVGRQTLYRLLWRTRAQP